jgi:hypothetical protein
VKKVSDILLLLPPCPLLSPPSTTTHPLSSQVKVSLRTPNTAISGL